jgi:hemerythrin
MKDLEWKDEYLLGIPELDLQHKRIFACFEAMAKQGPSKRDRWLADSSIVQLIGLLQQHFALEESLMRILAYPGFERHVEEHLHFNGELHDLAQKSLRTKESVSGEMVKLAQNWLRMHIMTCDKQCADYYAGLRCKESNRKQPAKTIKATFPPASRRAWFLNDNAVIAD